MTADLLLRVVAWVLVVAAWTLIGLSVAHSRSAWVRRAELDIVSALRRVRCALRPRWHPGFVRHEIEQRPLVAGPYSLTVGHALPGADPRAWTIARCVSCDEPEVW